MNMTRHFYHRQKWTAHSIQDSFAYNESLQHPADQLASPSAPLIEVLLFINILLFLDLWGIDLFRSNQRFQAIEFVDQPIIPEKL